MNSYCAGCGTQGMKICEHCGSWEFVTAQGLQVLRDVGRIDENLTTKSDSKREATAHRRYGINTVRDVDYVIRILLKQGYGEILKEKGYVK